MTDYSDYESWLADALLDAIIILRKEELHEPGARKELYAALNKIREFEDLYRAYWQEPRMINT